MRPYNRVAKWFAADPSYRDLDVKEQREQDFAAIVAAGSIDMEPDEEWGYLADEDRPQWREEA